MNEKNLVFVYGTLRKNDINHHLLQHAICKSRQCWTYGALYDTGCGYPAMIDDATNRVYGELYEVNEEELRQLDLLEDFEEGRNDNLYDRVIKPIFTETGAFDALVYVFNEQQATNLNLIDFGDWKCHRYLQEDELLYFAYGSCMDDERFRSQGVDQLFTDVVGCGVLKHHKLSYSLNFPDGGRADMMEEVDSHVEGKVYKIGKKALDYLFDREGVHTHLYRPAFVEVEINGVVHHHVLTFFVIEKGTETPPPEHYAIEILRGAKGVVSEEYYKKLQTHLHDNLKVVLKHNVDL